MPDADRCEELFRFGLFEADLRSRELRKNGRKIPLQGQPFQVFAILLRESGKVVTREELRQEVWPGDTFVDFDHGLNTAVTKIRTALGDSTDSPRYVETLPRLGYRFISPVDKPVSQPASPPAPKGRFEGRSPRVKWLLALGTLAVLMSGIVIWRFARNHADTSLPIEIVPLVGLPGLEFDPSFSPDGKQVAFVIRNPESSGIYTTVVGGEKSMRVTTHPGDSGPKWSPDGRQLAFIRYFELGVAIYVIPVLGGTEHRLYSSPAGINSRTVDWSPDGKSLAITEIAADRVHTWIALLSLADSTTHRITSPSDQDEDCDPAFSPDGSTIAFVRGITPGVVSDVYVVPTSGGEPKRLTHDNTWIVGPPAWTPDGRDIVFSSTRGGPPQSVACLHFWWYATAGSWCRPERLWPFHLAQGQSTRLPTDGL